MTNKNSRPVNKQNNNSMEVKHFKKKKKNNLFNFR